MLCIDSSLQPNLAVSSRRKLVFELPVTAPSSDQWAGAGFVPPAEETQTLTSRPTFPPTPYPILGTETPTVSPSTTAPAAAPVTTSPTRPKRPTGSPIELSDITQYNDGGTFIIKNDTSFTDESIIVSENTTLVLEEGGFIAAPLNTDWPAVR